MRRLALAGLLLIPLAAGAGGEKKEPKVMTGMRAPDLALEGAKNHASLASFHGKPVLIHIWATWCGPCKESMPVFKQLVEQYKKTDLVVLMLDRDESPIAAHTYLAQMGIIWPDYHDEHSRFLKTFGGSGIPATVLIDRDGIVRYHHTGEGVSEKSEGKLMRAIGRALATPMGGAPTGPSPEEP